MDEEIDINGRCARTGVWDLGSFFVLLGGAGRAVRFTGLGARNHSRSNMYFSEKGGGGGKGSLDFDFSNVYEDLSYPFL